MSKRFGVLDAHRSIYTPRATALHQSRSPPATGSTGAPGGTVSSLPAMPTLLFVTVPTDEVLNKEGQVRFPGTEAAVQQLTEAGWEVEVIDPLWPGPLTRVQAGGVDAVLVSCFKAVPRSRDAASTLSRLQPDTPVYTLGVLQKDDAFRTMAPAVGILRNLGEFPTG